MPLFLSASDTLNVLNDIVNSIQIESAFRIQHCRYQPMHLPNAVVDRYRQLPPPLQRRYQCQKLRDYLYDIYFSHEQELAAEVEQTTPLQNDTIRGMNRAFYTQLQDANQGKGYFDSGWQIIAASGSHRLAQKQGLTVQINPSYHLSDAEQLAQIGETVAIRLPKNRLESGFYVAVSDWGMLSEQASSLEIYFNVNATGAIPLMRELTAALNERQIAFTLKLLYEPTEYGRYDAGTLCLARDCYTDLLPLLKSIYQQIASDFCAAVPLFTKLLAPGLGLAEVPEAELRDFGLHRCQLVAKGLLLAWENGDETPEQRLSHIQQQFAQSQIDLRYPYLNPSSTDLYPSLD